MQTQTKSRLMGYWTPAADLREVRCACCKARTNFPVSCGWSLADDGDKWVCESCRESQEPPMNVAAVPEWPLLMAPAKHTPKPPEQRATLWGCLVAWWNMR